jgi:hypothetical protein
MPNKKQVPMPEDFNKLIEDLLGSGNMGSQLDPLRKIPGKVIGVSAKKPNLDELDKDWE